MSAKFDAIATVNAMIAANGDMSRDAIIISLVSEHGLTLNAATKAYGIWARATGVAKTIVSHKEDVHAWLAGEELTVATLAGILDTIVDEWGVKRDTAINYVKSYCKDNGLEYPVQDPRKAMFDWLVANAKRAAKDKAGTKAEFKKWAKAELNRSDSNINEYWKGMELHLAIMEAGEADTDDVKLAWATYETVKRDFEAGKRVSKAKVHPDKVSHLGDAELTEAYTKLFQAMNNKKRAA